MPGWQDQGDDEHEPTGELETMAQTARERLELAGQEHQKARDELARARDELRQAVLASLDEGMGESMAARLAGVDRMTVRSWAGKR